MQKRHLFLLQDRLGLVQFRVPTSGSPLPEGARAAEALRGTREAEAVRGFREADAVRRARAAQEAVRTARAARVASLLRFGRFGVPAAVVVAILVVPILLMPTGSGDARRSPGGRENHPPILAPPFAPRRRIVLPGQEAPRVRMELPGAQRPVGTVELPPAQRPVETLQTRTLVGRSRSQMRREAERLISRDPHHPLRFLLDESGHFRRTRGLEHTELLNRPELVQMGHIRSRLLGGRERLMLQGAFENQWNNVTLSIRVEAVLCCTRRRLKLAGSL